MLFKDDWDECRDRLTSWWRNEMPDRPFLGVTAPRRESLSGFPPPPPTDPVTQWTDQQYIFSQAMHINATTYFGGVCFPYITAQLGPGSLNTFLGSRPNFATDTVWYDPVFNNPVTADLRFDPEGEWWRWTLDTTRHFQQRSEGLCPVAIPDLVEGLDILSELLGTQELLMYLMECPEEIHRLLGQLDELYWNAFDPLYEVVKDERGGNAFMAFNIWGPGRTLKSQCDFSAMISPDMFAEYVCPYLEKQCARADFSIFHLDGPSCIGHLEHLLNVKSLSAVQWTPGYPNPEAASECWWKPIWEKVHGAGKLAVALWNRPELTEPYFREFGWKGSLFTSYASSEEEARALLEDSANWR